MALGLCDLVSLGIEGCYTWIAAHGACGLADIREHDGLSDIACGTTTSTRLDPKVIYSTRGLGHY